MSSLDGTNVPAAHFPKLTDVNYHTWKFDMQAMLMRNGSWLIVDGKITKPTSPGDAQDTWMIRDMNAAGVIYSYVTEPIQTLIRGNLNSSVDMWNTLKTHFSQDNAASRFLIFDEFFSIAKQPDESLSTVVSHVENGLQKIRSARPSTMTLQTFEEELAIMTLIRALPEEYGNFRSSLLLVPGTLTLKKVKEAFFQEERNRQPRVSDQIAMKASTSTSSKSKQRPQYVCTHSTLR